jgi:hypothetical protein
MLGVMRPEAMLCTPVDRFHPRNGHLPEFSMPLRLQGSIVPTLVLEFLKSAEIVVEYATNFTPMPMPVKTDREAYDKSPKLCSFTFLLDKTTSIPVKSSKSMSRSRKLIWMLYIIRNATWRHKELPCRRKHERQHNCSGLDDELLKQQILNAKTCLAPID